MSSSVNGAAPSGIGLAAPITSYMTPAPPAPTPESWKPSDVDAAFAAGLTMPETRVLRRKDDFPLFYPGKLNSLIGESESGKTWVALLAVVQEITAGNKAIFVDYEDSLISVLNRLILMGLDRTRLSTQFIYLRPDAKLNESAKNELEPYVREATVTVMDGVTEAMSIEGLKVNDMEDVAKFYNNVPKWFAGLGPATVLIDHVTKSKDDRGSYAIGSQHKKAGIDGTSISVIKTSDFALGKHGMATLKISKDKNGTVRARASAADIGTFHLKSNPATSLIDAWIDVPGAPVTSTTGTKTAASKVAQLVGKAKENPGESATALIKLVGMQDEAGRAALRDLVDDGFLGIRKRPGRGGGTGYFWLRDYNTEAPEGLEDL